MDALRLSQIVDKVIVLLEAKRKIELEAAPIEGFCVNHIDIVAVPPGFQVVKPQYADLIQAIVETGKEAAVWKLIGREPPRPKLVSDVTDDAGAPLDPRTLEPLP
jgi:hypothetical protein